MSEFTDSLLDDRLREMPDLAKAYAEHAQVHYSIEVLRSLLHEVEQAMFETSVPRDAAQTVLHKTMARVSQHHAEDVLRAEQARMELVRTMSEAFCIPVELLMGAEEDE